MPDTGDIKLNKTCFLHSKSSKSRGGDRNLNKSLEHNSLTEAQGEVRRGQLNLTKDLGKAPEDRMFKLCMCFNLIKVIFLVIKAFA